MSCNCYADAASTVIRASGRVSVSGSGTASDPYVISEAAAASTLALQVRDSGTVNLTLLGSGTTDDPYVLRADTGSASNLRSLGDVSSTPNVQQGAAPIWIGSPTGGHFEFRLPGVRYTTHAARGNGLYQGETIRETDTAGRFEWDGSQWVDLVPTTVAPSAFPPSIVQDAGTLSSTLDWNTLTVRSGIYRIGGLTSSSNAPAGAYGFGTLLVLMSGLSVTQTYYSHSYARLYQRTKWNASDWTGWTSPANQDDLNSSVNALNATIAQLRTDATNGDTDIRSNLATEVVNRTNQDNALLSNINTRATYDFVNALRSDAVNGDTNLQNSINQLRTDAQSGDTNLQGSINNEAGTRAAADAYLQGSINQLNQYRTLNQGGASKAQRGTGVITQWNYSSTTNNYYGTYTINLSGFNSHAPIVTPQSQDSGGVIAQVFNVSGNQFTIMLVRRNAADTGFYWHALGD